MPENLASERRYDCIVIGAGFAGVTAARDLREQGLDVLVIEARDRIGGRTWYKKYPGTNRGVEYGGTWFSTDWMTAIGAEVERYSIELVDQPAPQAFAWDLGGSQRTGVPLTVEEFAAAESLIAELHTAMAATPNGRLNAGVDYSSWDVPVSEWEPVKAAPAAVRDFVCAWASMYGGCAPDDVSVLHYTRLTAEFGNSVTSLYSGLAQKFAGGTADLIDAIVGSSREDILFNTAVTRITDDDEVVHVDTGATRYTARAVISTIPVNVLSTIEFDPALPAALADAIEVGHACKSIKVWARVRGVPDGLFGLGWPSTIQWLSNEYDLHDGTSLLVGFGHDQHRLTEHTVADAIRQYAPDVEVLSVDLHNWTDDPYSQGAWSIWGPGWVRDGHSEAFRQQYGRVHFAGSDFAESWPGWIDGAINSGTDAARAVISACQISLLHRAALTSN